MSRIGRRWPLAVTVRRTNVTEMADGQSNEVEEQLLDLLDALQEPLKSSTEDDSAEDLLTRLVYENAAFLQFAIELRCEEKQPLARLRPVIEEGLGAVRAARYEFIKKVYAIESATIDDDVS